MKSSSHHLSSADIGVVATYFVLVIAIGLWAMWKSNRSTVSGYFLAGRSMWFLPIAASLFVSNIGTEHYIGLAGSGAAQGITVAAWELNAVLLLQLLGWVFLPVYISSGICTMPEYLSRRFGGNRLRSYYAALSLGLYILLKCSATLYTGALFIQQAMNWDLYLSMIGLVVVTALLTLTGGLTAVMYTDTLQAFLMVGGACYLAIISFQEVGGFTGILEKYPQAVPTNASAIVPNTTCHYPDKQAFTLLRSADDSYVPWVGFVFGTTAGSVWYWCSDQVIVQRALAAKSISHAKGATLLAGLVKVLPLFIMVMPGMVSRILYPNEVACTNPDYCMEVCGHKAGCSNIAYPKLVLGLMPEGARGLMMAVIIAALMSDLDSIFNSAGTLFSMDVWRRFRKRVTNFELTIVGRIFIVVMVGVSIAWVPVIAEQQNGQIFIYTAEVGSYLLPPLGVIFLLGVLVPVVNETGAFWALMLALVTGLVRLFSVLILKGEEYCGSTDPYPEPPVLKNIHYMYFALLSAVMTAVAAIVISVLSGKSDKKLLHRTTFWSVRRAGKEERLTDITELQSSLDNGKRNGNDNVWVDTDLILEPLDDSRRGTVSSECDTDHENVPSPGMKILHFLCGGQHQKQDEEKSAALKAHLEEIARLEQGRCMKWFLNISLVLVLAVGVGMYVFWSVYKFDTSPFYPANATHLLPGDKDKE